MKTGQKKRLLGGIDKTRTLWEKWYETIKEEKLQSNRDVTVQCTDFCEVTTSDVHAVLRHAPVDLRGGTLLQHPRVLVASVAYQENPHLCLQILHSARFQVFRGAYCYGYWLTRRVKRHRGFLRISEDSRVCVCVCVCVLGGPAIVITNVMTASVFLAKGWSTESVSRVARTARTTQEKHGKELVEHAYYSHIHDEVTLNDTFPATIQKLDEDEKSPGRHNSTG